MCSKDSHWECKEILSGKLNCFYTIKFPFTFIPNETPKFIISELFFGNEIEVVLTQNVFR